MVVERDNYDRSIRIIDRKDMVTRDLLSFALFPRCCVILRISRRRSDVGRGKTPSFEADCYPSLPREYFSLSRAANRNIPFFLFFFFFPFKSLRFLRFPRAKRRMYRSKTTPACIPSSCASDRFRRVTRVSFPVLGGKRLWRKRVGKEEERVTIQRCTKIVRFPERKTRARAYMCGCICVCVCVTIDRYGYRLFTAVAWPDKSTERCCSPSFLYRLHATQPGPAFNHAYILLILTHSFPPPR